MGHTFCVLTVGLLVGQAPVILNQNHESVEPGCNCQGRTSVSVGWFPRIRNWTWNGSAIGEWVEDRPLLGRIQERFSGLFNRQEAGTMEYSTSDAIHGIPVQSYTPSQIPIINSPAPAGEYLQRLPTKISLSEPPLLEVTAQPARTEFSTIKQVSFQSAQPDAAVQPANFGPAQARLSDKVGHEEDYSWITGQIQIENGGVVIHYANPETVDRFGGRMVLSTDLNMSGYQSGDLVTVHGGVILGRAGITTYRVQAIDLLERPVR